MKTLLPVFLCTLLAAPLFVSPAAAKSPAAAQPLAGPSAGTIVDRATRASSAFVDFFNVQNSFALGALYAQDGVLKLPGAPAVSGRSTVAQAWQQGFDAGLDFLELDNEFTSIGPDRVLEDGTYALTIQTPNGPVIQEGTFAVLWDVPAFPQRPKILFDTIDAD